MTIVLTFIPPSLNRVAGRGPYNYRKAQEECTRQGILLPCPMCKGKADEGRQTDVDGYYWWPTIYCGCCGLHLTGVELWEEATEEMRSKWNTRPAPQVGRCGDCANWYKGHCTSGTVAEETDADFYCPNFEPKGSEENG